VSPNVFLFTDPITGSEHGYTDGWQSDGCFHYTGEGQRGDQQMKSGNAAVLNHRTNGRALRLFEGSGGYVRYVDEFAVDTAKPFYTIDAPETGGGPVRSVIVFRLQPSTIVSPPSTGTLEFSDVPRVDELPVENQMTERTWVEPSRDPYEAERREAALVLRFRDHLLQKGHDPIRLRVIPAGEAKPILCDLYVRDIGLLVEAKGSVERGSIRMAIGQLMDYRRFVREPRCALLLPELPRPDLVAMIRQAGLDLYWPEGSDFRRISGS
jgi:hypothetical protein